MNPRDRDVDLVMRDVDHMTVARQARDGFRLCGGNFRRELVAGTARFQARDEPRNSLFRDEMSLKKEVPKIVVGHRAGRFDAALCDAIINVLGRLISAQRREPRDAIDDESAGDFRGHASLQVDTHDRRPGTGPRSDAGVRA